MFELLLCSLLTIFPDYLFRRFAEGKRIGRDITLYTVWYELRWGITACLMLTIGLITVVFYNHPSTSNVTLFFRTVPIVPETNGRVAEIYVGLRDKVQQGQPIFRLDSSKQEAAVETGRRKITEVEASMVMAQGRTRAGCPRIRTSRLIYAQSQGVTLGWLARCPASLCAGPRHSRLHLPRKVPVAASDRRSARAHTFPGRLPGPRGRCRG